MGQMVNALYTSKRNSAYPLVKADRDTAEAHTFYMKCVSAHFGIGITNLKQNEGFGSSSLCCFFCCSMQACPQEMPKRFIFTGNESNLNSVVVIVRNSTATLRETLYSIHWVRGRETNLPGDPCEREGDSLFEISASGVSIQSARKLLGET